MIPRGVLVFTLFMQLGLTANLPIRERHEPTISECAARGGECDESKGRPVCGTDDQTYPTRCHLLRVQCSGHQVSLKYRGPCKACKEARDYALKHKTRHPPKFIPRCKPDGTYASIQCLGDTGCWCSDITGKPIENTSVRTGKPRCRGLGKANIRRSPSRNLGPNRGRRVCTHADRTAFNSNLMKVFQSEYIRSGQHRRDDVGDVGGAGDVGGNAAPDSLGPPDERQVLDWKFAHLDVNANQMLDKNEYRELKKLVKRAVKPRRCGRAFGKFCDMDSDERLSRLEWNTCLSQDVSNHHLLMAGHKSNATDGHISNNNKSNNNSNNHKNKNSKKGHNSFFSNSAHRQLIHDNNNNNNNNNNNQNTIHNNNHNNNNNSNNRLHPDSLDENESHAAGDDDDDSSQRLDYDDDEAADYDPEEGDDDDDDHDVHDHLGIIKTFGLSTNYPSIYFLRPKPESPLKESEGEYDCLADQAAALEEQRHGNTRLYVPECTADGRYQRVQCYRSTPYCWCVHEDTGKNIPGTSVKDKRPQCDAVYTVSRPMKGCPEPRKTAFLKDLKEFLKTQILTGTSTGANTTKWSTEDERIATLSFVLLDKNKNKAWERKEWKTFRELVTNSKILRKCGKKMPRYCDVNSDKKITLSEWLNCLQTQRIELNTTTQPVQQQQSNESAVSSKPLKLTGSNPLEQYLKD